MKSLMILFFFIFICGCKSGGSSVADCSTSIAQGNWVDTTDPTHSVALDSACKVTSSQFGEYASYPANLQAGTFNDVPLTFYDDQAIAPNKAGLNWFDTPKQMICDLTVSTASVNFACFNPDYGFFYNLDLVRQ